MILTAVPVISVAHGPLRRSNTLTPEIIKPLKDFASAKAGEKWKNMEQCFTIMHLAFRLHFLHYILQIFLLEIFSIPLKIKALGNLTRVKVHPLGSFVMTSTFERCLSLYIFAGWTKIEFITSSVNKNFEEYATMIKHKYDCYHESMPHLDKENEDYLKHPST